MKTPLVCRPMRSYKAGAAIYSVIGLALLALTVTVAKTEPVVIGLLFLGLYLFCAIVSLGLYRLSENTVVFLAENIVTFEPIRKKYPVLPWAAVKKAYLVRNFKGQRFLILSADEVGRRDLRRRALCYTKVLDENILTVWLDCVGKEDERPLLELVGEKVGQIVDLGNRPRGKTDDGVVK